jgi:hypothetical protein
MASFLQKELLADQYVNLEQAGHAAEDKTPMARVFIDLPCSRHPGMTEHATFTEEQEGRFYGFAKEFVFEGARRLAQDFELSKDIGQGPRPVAGRFVLVGGPGQGKTTVGQFICQLHRAALLATRPRSSTTKEVRAALDLIKSQCGADEIDLPVCKRFPFRIVLNHLARELSAVAGSKSVLSSLQAESEFVLTIR